MLPPSRDATIVQFSLRSLFVVTLIAAVASAVFAPRMQDANAVLIAAMWVGSYAILVGAVCWYRVRLEKRAGKLLFRCRPRPWSAMALFAVAMPAIVMALIIFLWTDQQGANQTGGLGSVYAVESGIISGWVTMSLWWRSSSDRLSLEFFDSGVVFGRIWFRPWSDVLRFRWLVDHRSRLTIQFRINQIEVAIHPDEHDEVDALLTARVKHFVLLLPDPTRDSVPPPA